MHTIEKQQCTSSKWNVFNTIGSLLKHCKIQKYYDQDCLKIFFCTAHFQWWFKFLEKILIWFKKVSSVKKLPVTNGESFLESIFDLN